MTATTPLLSTQGIHFYSQEFATTFASFMHDCGQCKLVKKFLNSHISCTDGYKALYEAAHSCASCKYNIAMKDMVDVMIELENLYTGDRKSARRMEKVLVECVDKITQEAGKLGINVQAPYGDDVEQVCFRRWKYKLDDTSGYISDP